MTARDAAAVIKAWAQENHLLKTEFPVDLNVEQEEKDQLFDSLAISYQAEAVLRQRGITGVAFNDAANEVIIFTDKSVLVKDQKILPEAVMEGIKVRYMHGGLAQAGNPAAGNTASPYTIRNARFACGGSIHPVKTVGAGTLGCLVKDAAGVLYGLTNNHVSGMCNYANTGEKILAPGHVDITAAGLDPFTLGYHTKSLPMVHGLPDNVDITTNNDAALVRVANEDSVTSYQGNVYDTPVNAFDILPNQTVEKVGRTTGHTKGHVVGQFIGPHAVKYNVAGYGDHISFFDPVFVIQGENGNPFSMPGDSGSLITIEQNGERFGVGLVFAGDPSRGLTFALPLKPILDTLNVTLTSQHNV